MVGYWEPHSSSVEFCEPNYFLTSYDFIFHSMIDDTSSMDLGFLVTFGYIFILVIKQISIQP